MPNTPLTTEPRDNGRSSLPMATPCPRRRPPLPRSSNVSPTVPQSAGTIVPFRRSSPSTLRSRIPLRPVRSLAAKPPPHVPMPPVNHSLVPDPAFLFSADLCELSGLGVGVLSWLPLRHCRALYPMAQSPSAVFPLISFPQGVPPLNRQITPLRGVPLPRERSGYAATAPLNRQTTPLRSLFPPPAICGPLSVLIPSHGP
jgi:hypothetical protein